MALSQLARGLWSKFSILENPFTSPNGMEENLRLIDDHLGLYTLAPPQAPGTALPAAPADGDGQIYTDGTYSVFNAGTWKSYMPRKGVRAVLASGSDSWLNTGTAWGQYSVVDSSAAIAAATAAGAQQVSLATAQAALAAGSEGRAALSAQQAGAAGRARPSVEFALADGSIAAGQSFSAPLPSGAIQSYLKYSSSSFTPIGEPFATNASVTLALGLVANAVAKLVEQRVANNSWPYTEFAFRGWQVGFVGGLELRYVDLTLSGLATASTITLRARYRPASAGVGKSDAADVLAFEQTYPAADIGTTNAATLHRFDLGKLVRPADARWIIEVTTNNASGVAIGIGRRDGVAGIDQLLRGYYFNGNSSSWEAISSGGTVASIAYATFVDEYALKGTLDNTQVTADLGTLQNLTTEVTNVLVGGREHSTPLFPHATNFDRWIVGMDGEDEIESADVRLSGIATNTGIRVIVRYRAGSAVTATDAGDVTVYDQTLPSASLAPDNAVRIVPLNFGKLVKPAGARWILDLIPVGGTLGMGYVEGITNVDQLSRGYYRTTASSAIQAINNGGVFAALTYRAYKAVRSAKQQAETPQANALRLDKAIISVGTNVAAVTGTTYKDGTATSFVASVAVPFAASGMERVDLLQIHRISGMVSRVAGTERALATAKDALEWQPAVSANCIRIGALRVDATTIDAVTTAGFRGLIKAGFEGEWSRLKAANAKAIRRTVGKAMRGVPIKLGNYGDSIGAIQLGTVPYTANGATRDRPDGYFSAYPADTRALIKLFTALELNMADDGAGRVHSCVGWAWEIKRALDRIAGAVRDPATGVWSGQVVKYFNYGVGSTASRADLTSGGLLNGLHPDRIAIPKAEGLDLALPGFGMNELGASTTYANMVEMANQFLSVDAEVAMVGVPRINPMHMSSLAAWQYTNQAIEAAAMDTGSAYIPLAAIVDDRNLGAMGVPANVLCSTNRASGNNHPGLFELQRYAALAVEALSL